MQKSKTLGVSRWQEAKEMYSKDEAVSPTVSCVNHWCNVWQGIKGCCNNKCPCGIPQHGHGK
eukprot:6443751-Ditylum_brightwellii.AAC.1